MHPDHNLNLNSGSNSISNSLSIPSTSKVPIVKEEKLNNSQSEIDLIEKNGEKIPRFIKPIQSDLLLSSRNATNIINSTFIEGPGIIDLPECITVMPIKMITLILHDSHWKSLIFKAFTFKLHSLMSALLENLEIKNIVLPHEDNTVKFLFQLCQISLHHNLFIPPLNHLILRFVIPILLTRVYEIHFLCEDNKESNEIIDEEIRNKKNKLQQDFQSEEYFKNLLSKAKNELFPNMLEENKKNEVEVDNISIFLLLELGKWIQKVPTN